MEYGHPRPLFPGVEREGQRAAVRCSHDHRGETSLSYEDKSFCGTHHPSRSSLQAIY